MSNLAPLLVRNRAFAETDARRGLGLRPRFGAVILTCLDPRVDPVGFLGLELADAPVLRNECGTGALANPEVRAEFAERTGYRDGDLAATAVNDPTATVRLDVERLLGAPQVSSRITVSGHVYDLDSGLVETIVTPLHPESSAI